jgi:hypothetical protein
MGDNFLKVADGYDIERLSRVRTSPQSRRYIEIIDGSIICRVAGQDTRVGMGCYVFLDRGVKAQFEVGQFEVKGIWVAYT